jgi:uncharacterized membrane protein
MFLSGVGLGAGLMYLLDPEAGRRRRALSRDKAMHALHEQRGVVEKGVRDLRNRAEGVRARTRGALAGEEVSDRVLVDRVRAEIGRHVTHPGSIHVSAFEGEVTLTGPIFRREVDRLVRAVRRVPGVRSVRDELEAHETADGIPGLQGAGTPPRRPPLQREAWPPGTRLVAGGLGLALGSWGSARGGLVGGLFAVAGGSLLARAVFNAPTKRLTGLGAGREAIRLQKTLHIDAPVEEVYLLWSNFERFPQFMEHVQEVRLAGPDRTHWKIDGLAKAPFSFDAEITERVPNEVLAWKSVPGAVVEHAGIVRFEEEAGGTRVGVDLSYDPPGGAVTHAVVSLLGADAKSRLDDDLLRMKTLLEGGTTRAHGERVSREDVLPASTGGAEPSRT